MLMGWCDGSKNDARNKAASKMKLWMSKVEPSSSPMSHCLYYIYIVAYGFHLLSASNTFCTDSIYIVCHCLRIILLSALEHFGRWKLWNVHMDIFSTWILLFIDSYLTTTQTVCANSWDILRCFLHTAYLKIPLRMLPLRMRCSVYRIPCIMRHRLPHRQISEEKFPCDDEFEHRSKYNEGIRMRQMHSLSLSSVKGILHGEWRATIKTSNRQYVLAALYVRTNIFPAAATHIPPHGKRSIILFTWIEPFEHWQCREHTRWRHSAKPNRIPDDGQLFVSV